MKYIKNYTQVLRESADEIIDPDVLDMKLANSFLEDDIDACRSLLEAGADPNAFLNARLGVTILHAIVRESIPNLDFLKLFLEYGADPNYAVGGKQAPIHIAVDGAKLEALELLLQNRGNPNLKGSHGETPLHMIAKKYEYSSDTSKTMEMIELLFKYNANPNLEDFLGSTPLIKAIIYANDAAWGDRYARKGQFEKCKKFIEHGAEVNTENKTAFYDSALSIACLSYNIDIAKLIVENGADVNQVVNGMSIFHRVIKFNNTGERENMLKLLIKNGVDPLEEMDSPQDVIDLFDGDIDWMPAELKQRLQLAKRSKKMFGI